MTDSAWLSAPRRRWLVRLTPMLVASFAGACTVGPHYRPPRLGAPLDFDAGLNNTGTASATQPSASGNSAAGVDLTVWWRALDDAELNALVSRAAAANFDIRIALARLQETRESEYVTGGGALPGLGGTQGVSVVGAAGRSSGNNAARGRLSGPVYSGVDTSGVQEVTHVVGFDAGWELDLFGRYSRLIEAAGADAQAAAEYRNDVLIAVVCDVVRSYVQLRSYQLRLEIAVENVAAQQRTAMLVRTRFNRGLTNELDAVLAERQLAATTARIAPLQAAVASSERRLAVLCGRYPSELAPELDRPKPLPAAPPGVRPGMPVELLRRRPDIRQAERELAAANARIGVATANLFPRVSVTAGAGLQGQGLGRAPVENSLVWSVGPTLNWPLLDFGQVDALIKVQDYRTERAYWNYRKTVVLAVQEVDNALTNYTAQQQSFQQLGKAVEASRRAVTLATRRYEDGLTDFLNVLDAQRQLFDLQDQYAVANEALIDDFASLYKALGGGWEGFEGPPPAMTPLPAILAAASPARQPAVKDMSAANRVR